MADEGLHGLLDFVGYPVGAAVQVAPGVAGFYGLGIDFTGVPVGVPTVRPAASVVGGKRPPAHIQAWVQEQVRRERERAWVSLVDRMERRQAAESWLRSIEAQYQKKCLEWAVYSVLISEL